MRSYQSRGFANYTPAPSRRRGGRPTHSFLPLMIAIMIVAAIVLSVRFLVNKYSEETPVGTNGEIYFTLESGEGRILNVAGVSLDILDHNPHNVYEGEAIQLLPDAYGSMKWNQMLLRVAGNTKLAVVAPSKGETGNLSLLQGEVWISADKDAAQPVRVETGLAYLKMQYGVADFQFTGGQATVRVIKGSAEVGLLDPMQKNAPVVIPVSLGQTLAVTASSWKDVADGLKQPLDLVAETDDTFRNGAWYKFNTGQDTLLGAREQEEAAVTEEEATDSQTGSGTVSVSFPPRNYTTNKSTLKVTGQLGEGVDKVLVNGLAAEVNGNRWVLPTFELKTEGKNTLIVEAVRGTEKEKISTLTVTLDTEAPAAPTVVSPENGTKTAEGVVKITGTAGIDSAQIVVNDYTLQKYKPGDRNWTYIANKNYGDLKSGNNTYQVYAVDAAGNKSPVTTLTIEYTGTTPPTSSASEVSGSLNTTSGTGTTD